MPSLSPGAPPGAASLRDRAHQCLRAALATLLRGQSIPFSVNLRGARPDKDLAVGRTRLIYVHTRDSIVSVAHPSLPVAPLQDASNFGLFFPGCWRSPRDPPTGADWNFRAAFCSCSQREVQPPGSGAVTLLTLSPLENPPLPVCF
jgi:hypothetical protein